MTISAHPLVTRARRLAAELLLPEAERVDQEGVPVSHIEAVKRSGLLGVVAPVAYGGSGAPPAVLRETAEILAGACCSTWFVQTQHHTPVQTLTQSGLPVRERLLGPLSRGELLSGVAYAHLRSYPRVPVRVRRAGDGWRFDGTVPWYTGWGLNDVMLLAGTTDAGEVLFAFTEAREQPGLRASAPMRLAALTAARTVSLELDGLRVPEEAVALRAPYETWAPRDRARTLNATPAVFGVAEAALALLDEEPAAPLLARLADVRRRAYALADHPVPHERTEERLAVRAEAYDVLGAATTAAVVAGGGRAMALTSRAQRLAREGLFLLVQGQTAETRRAHLRALALGAGGA
ncbi:alkylation response protein AidB-like acyl-CoA dehydrogenase [Streptomyces griseochromogenes]|uniref:Acyl-CoA dehydrogenase n=1 Tax=Streptomyces griseochromogenes TaxID=68214 RepID=A0A1B1B1W4_9ACTN|nr:acyl-CoA dehydrogenase family protein [Streptomyces griseochromogenes]ANP52799.1 acyl-CoA dehydrogenase [Streptomyces griseochromogenes]MBP2047415.1 alkylation response protein AidB-like acyl-CoA dehydrogenase [Streptomyces griseochromogenes]